MKTGVFNEFPQRHLKKKTSKKKKVFQPTDPKKFGGITGNKTFFFYALKVICKGQNLSFLLYPKGLALLLIVIIYKFIFSVSCDMVIRPTLSKILQHGIQFMVIKNKDKMMLVEFTNSFQRCIIIRINES